MQLLFQFILLLFVFGAILMIASLVYKGSKNRVISKYFIWMCISTSGWIITNLLYQLVSTQQLQYAMALFSYGCAISIAYSFYVFCIAITQDYRLGILKNRYLKISNSALAAIVGILSMMPGVVASGVAGDGDIVTNSVALTVYAVVLLSIFMQGLAMLSAAARHSKNDQRRQFVTILCSLVIAVAVGLLFNLALPITGNYTYVALGPTGSIFLVFGTAYAIFRYQLFDTRIVVARLVAYVASISLLVVIYIFVGVLVTRALLGEEMSLNAQIYVALSSAVLAIMFHPIRKFFDKITNAIFYRDAYNAQDLINNINSCLVKSIKIEDLLDEISHLIEKDMNLSSVNFYIDRFTSIDFHIVGSNKSVVMQKGWNELISKIIDNGMKIISVDSRETLPEVAVDMRNLGFASFVKMISGGENVGYVIVGERKNGNRLSHQDIQVLEIISDSVAVAVQNMLRYEQIARFNITLQQKVDEATRELQKSNEKLKQLDEAKDEFISMASHQLRTPLTSVKGYISMMLEGDAGEINETQRKFLDQAYVSSQRMVYLIADLLNVSRLKTGKFIIEPAPTYLPDVVESEIAQLYETAKARELELIFHKPDSFPELNLDETKIRQVIMNFADNAIYYTPRGGKIKLELKQKQSSVEFTVSDNGIGVPKNEQHRLFTKFYRAGNARKARPDGTGLGLFMAKKVVIAQGGAIIFRTSEGKGSTFGFSFPRAKLEVND